MPKDDLKLSKAQRAQRRAEYAAELSRLVPDAIAVLEAGLRAPQPGIRLRAAKDILDRRFGRAQQTTNVNVQDESRERAVLESLSDEDLEKYVSVLDKLREGPTTPEPAKPKRGH